MRKGLYTSFLFLLLGWSASGKAQKPIFDHIAIHVGNLAKSISFYVDIVGLDTLPEPFRDGRHAWLNMGAGMQLHLIAGAPPKEDHHIDNHMALRVPSVESLIAQLEKAGIPYVNARGKKNAVTIRPDSVKQIYFQDPDGYWIEINDVKK